MIIPLSYFFLLPKSSVFFNSTPYSDASVTPGPASDSPYAPIPTDEPGEEASLLLNPKKGVALSASDKWELVKPQFFKYMLLRFSQLSDYKFAHVTKYSFSFFNIVPVGFVAQIKFTGLRITNC